MISNEIMLEMKRALIDKHCKTDRGLDKMVLNLLNPLVDSFDVDRLSNNLCSILKEVHWLLVLERLQTFDILKHKTTEGFEKYTVEEVKIKINTLSEIMAKKKRYDQTSSSV